MRNSQKTIRLIIIFLLGFFLGSLFFRLNNPTKLVVENDIIKQKYRQLTQIHKLLSEEYYDADSLDFEEIMDQVSKSFVDAVGDPYTVFFNESENLDFQNTLKGGTDLEGIGAVVSKKEYYLQLDEIIKDGPAFLAGLRPLDRIVEIDEESVKEEDIEEAVVRLRGEAGTEVYLMIERDMGDNVITFHKTITRDKIVIPSVMTQILETDDGKKIAYIEIFVIGEETSSLFKAEVEELKKESINAVILDLRGNGGGYMLGAVEIASYFLPRGDMILHTKYQAYPSDKEYSKGYDGLQDLPVVVIIDGLTASAGEIIALAMRENLGITVLGTQSFGKGSIQVIEEFEDQSLLKYSVGKWFSPSGTNIDKIGIKPDIELEFDIDKYISDSIDNQLVRALELLDK